MSLAIRDSVKTRRLIQSPEYQKLYGGRYGLLGDQNAKEKFENTKLGYRMCTAVGAATTGEGGDRLVLDDPHNVLEAYSEPVRNSTLTWVREGWSTRVNDRKASTKTVVMQRVHAEDVSAHFLAEGGWEHLCLPNEFEEALRKITGIGWTDPRTAEGELLNPARLGPDELPKVKKELGSLGYSGQMQQRPTPAAGGFFKRSWWGYYGKGTNHPLPKSFDLLIGSWDCAFKDKPTSDYVVGLVIGYKAPNFYLLEVIRDRLDYPATKREIELQLGRWPGMHAVLIEDKANGPAVIAELKRKWGRIVAVNPEGGKMSRAAAASPVVECGEFLLPSPGEGRLYVTDFVDEHAGFPLAAYDDQVDAMTQGVIWLRAKLGLRVVTASQLREASR
jgi:predicted phage terminase large subunit-like protein